MHVATHAFHHVQQELLKGARNTGPLSKSKRQQSLLPSLKPAGIKGGLDSIPSLEAINPFTTQKKDYCTT